MAGQRVLVSTLPPFEGGVPAKTETLCRLLRARGHAVTVAYYATFHHSPGVNVPAWRLAVGAAPGVAEGRCFGDFPAIAVGCRLPELEAPYYLGSARWRRLAAAHDRHIAVGGTTLVSHPLLAAGVPHLLWCASGVIADRRDRAARMPPGRRLVDRWVVEPWLRRLERRILAAPTPILGVSEYTRRSLVALGGSPERIGVLPIPVAVDDLAPAGPPAAAGVIGFAGRFEDPRKNIGLLLQAVARLRAAGAECRLRLAGTEPSPALRALVDSLGLTGAVEFVGALRRDQLPDFYRSLDVFVIPSHQEGLCIAGIEAMAAGVPVVSTRCGGPEDFVRPGETGLLAADDPAELAARLAELAADRTLRARLAEGARALAVARYSPSGFALGLAAAWRGLWGDEP
jgi:glycosyltransferase involved in cell wall biosynthesis